MELGKEKEKAWRAIVEWKEKTVIQLALALVLGLAFSCLRIAANPYSWCSFNYNHD